jgi:hypothetical protein
VIRRGDIERISEVKPVFATYSSTRGCAQFLRNVPAVENFAAFEIVGAFEVIL